MGGEREKERRGMEWRKRAGEKERRRERVDSRGHAKAGSKDMVDARSAFTTPL